MKSIRKIAGKVTALAVAITTSVALLSPYDANATSGATSWENGGGSGGSAKCGWTPKSTQCTQITVTGSSGSGSGFIDWWNKTFGGDGGSSQTVTSITMWKTLCESGTARACTFSDPCAEYNVTYSCNPNCTVKIN